MSRSFPFSITVGAAADGTGKQVLVLHACYCIDGFPPHNGQLVLIIGAPGPLRPELIVLHAEKSYAMGWLVKNAKVNPRDAVAILDAAEEQEEACRAIMRQTHAENFGKQMEQMKGT